MHSTTLVTTYWNSFNCFKICKWYALPGWDTPNLISLNCDLRMYLLAVYIDAGNTNLVRLTIYTYYLYIYINKCILKKCVKFKCILNDRNNHTN